MHDLSQPSDWICRWSGLLPARAAVLDLACGRGRNLRWLHGQGHQVLGVDRDAEAIASLTHLGEMLVADIENEAWPLRDTSSSGFRQFDAIVVCNYLWRPLFPTLIASLKPGGLLIYETFAKGHEALGRPTRPEFVLNPMELLQLSEGMHVIAYEELGLDSPPRFVQRIVARRADQMACELHVA